MWCDKGEHTEFQNDTVRGSEHMCSIDGGLRWKFIGISEIGQDFGPIDFLRKHFMQISWEIGWT